MPTTEATVPTVLYSRAEPWTRSRFAGQAGPQPLVRGFQNSIAAMLLPMFQA